MSDALAAYTLSNGQTISGPMVAWYLARAINRLAGTSLGPWDLAQLDDATLAEARQLMAGTSGGANATLSKIAALKAQWRADHERRH